MSDQPGGPGGQPEISSFTGKYRFLSNFEPCAVKLDDVYYASTEAAYQAAKSLDPEVREYIRESKGPGQAKSRGRRIVIRPDWEDAKIGIMRELLAQKFARQPLLGQLLATKDYYLREGNTWGDRIWGCVWNPGLDQWEGENHLGLLLMELRTKLLGPEPEVLSRKVADRGC